MGIKEELTNLLQQAKLYQKQGLLEDAKNKFKTAVKLLQENENIKNRENLIDIISKKIGTVDSNVKRIAKTTQPKDISPETQELIKNLFAFSKDNDKGAALLEGAIALAKFGQHERALKEFHKLLKSESLRIVVAKNILRCHIELDSLKKAVAQFKKWLDDDRFSTNQLKKIRFFLATTIKKKGEKIALPEVEEKEIEEIQIDDLEEEIVDLNTIQKGEQAEVEISDLPIPIQEDEDFLDISSIGITLETGPHKGKVREFDVSFQSGNKLCLVISQSEEKLLNTFNVGKMLKDIQLFSPIAILNGTGVVAAKKKIEAGPKRGDYSLDIVIESA
jgi:hypothetical protein